MKTTAFVGTSLDGFIAREDGTLDFLPAVEGESHGYEELMASVDALVMGRRTFETVLSFGAWPYGGKPVFVLSTRPLPEPMEGAVVERMEGDPVAIAAQLDARGVSHAYVDGGVTVQRFLSAGLLDRIVVTRVPVLIGRGTPLFGPLQNDIVLRHVATRTFPGGLVQSEYDVVRDGAP